VENRLNNTTYWGCWKLARARIFPFDQPEKVKINHANLTGLNFRLKWKIINSVWGMDFFCLVNRKKKAMRRNGSRVRRILHIKPTKKNPSEWFFSIWSTGKKSYETELLSQEQFRFTKRKKTPRCYREPISGWWTGKYKREPISSSLAVWYRTVSNSL
jgi:hypothetical protein